MKVLLQRVSRAEVRVDGTTVGRIGHGLLALVGVERGDDPATCDYLSARTAKLRVFADDDGRMNRSVGEVGGAVLVVSQFTLAARTRRGLRPSYAAAELPELAEPMIGRFVEGLQSHGLHVEQGRFRASMQVELVNDGPVTIMLEPPAGDD